MNKHARLKEYLQTLISENPSTLYAAVADEALEYHVNDLTAFFTDVIRHGCQSGIVSGLIYYTDTHAFFDKHYEEIEQLRVELEEDFGQPLQPKGDLKNWYAWLAFEETARKIADKFELE